MPRDARSVLYMPAHRPKMLEKMASIPADFFVVDLEDGLPPAEMAAADSSVNALFYGSAELRRSGCSNGKIRTPGRSSRNGGSREP